MNESAKHTPGPWEWSGTVLVGDGGKITLLRSVNVWNAKEADKALIAAAPDLLAALQAAASSAGFQYMLAETRDQIDAALTKAGSPT